MTPTKHFCFETEKTKFVLVLYVQWCRGNAELHFGHISPDCDDFSKLSFEKCQISNPLPLFRWLMASIKESIEICIDKSVNTLYLSSYEADGHDGWRRECASKIIWKLPEVYHQWISNHVSIL